MTGTLFNMNCYTNSATFSLQNKNDNSNDNDDNGNDNINDIIVVQLKAFLFSSCLGTKKQ